MGVLPRGSFVREFRPVNLNAPLAAYIQMGIYRKSLG